MRGEEVISEEDEAPPITGVSVSGGGHKRNGFQKDRTHTHTHG